MAGNMRAARILSFMNSPDIKMVAGAGGNPGGEVYRSTPGGSHIRLTHPSLQYCTKKTSCQALWGMGIKQDPYKLFVLP
jgi:hypothetical protein